MLPLLRVQEDGVSRIDWFAVDCVLGGTKLPLNAEERKAVVRRMEHRLLPIGVNCAPGMLTSEQLGDRMGCGERAVEHIRSKLPAADKLQCDVCGEQMWVRHDGDIIEPHSDYLFKECPTSGTVFDGDWESELANTTVWLARRLRDDPRGVWEYVERVQVSQMRRLLVAALAGVAESDDPFEWLKEAV